ncbi:hypothetical protein INQ51_06010 [Maribellus sp. CM-23]|uniref:hypothetical protein n=1 Tax=Maribellus sp. CM-23 TaxID=2781026 RepID=UPI001F449FC6|nr:hypothetical protein [Maribellus sp. CM-23]MCE4563859.1 hypothetical protein [Maribellus sp. CM-23]
MKVLTLLILLGLSLAGVGQNANTLKPLPKLGWNGLGLSSESGSLVPAQSLKLDSLTLDEWKDPYMLRYGKKKDQQEQAMIQPNSSPAQENINDPWNMPVAKPGAGNWNMPVAVPDSTVDYFLKMKKIGQGNDLRK